MIEGTRSFRSKRAQEREAELAKARAENPPPAPEAAPRKPLEEITPADSAPESAPTAQRDDVNLERRQWFASLVPAAGEGLVKLLRASNNLQRDLHEAMRAGADEAAERERRARESK